MNSKLDLGQQALLKKIDNKIIYKLISVMKLPMVLISGIKIDSITEEICSTSVRYRYINKNPFNSTYFAVLSMAAELSTGALALLSAGGVNSDISFIITGMEAKFVKKDENGFVYPLKITKRIEDDFKTFITPEWQEELFNLE